MSARGCAKAVAIVAAILAAVVLAVAAYDHFYGPRWVYHPKPFNEAAYNRAVRWLKASGKTRLQSCIPLPPELASLSADGKAVVSRGLIFFPSWVGSHYKPPDSMDEGWMEGYCYSEKPLPKDSTDGMTGIDMSEPAHEPNDQWTGELEFGRRLAPHWYEADDMS